MSKSSKGKNTAEAVATAEAEPCETCGAEIGDPCVSTKRAAYLIGGRSSRFARTSKPHASRLRAAGVLALLVALLAGCVDEPVAVAPVLERCGDAPSAPGFVAAFDGDVVTMSRATYTGITDWYDATARWQRCASSDLYSCQVLGCTCTDYAKACTCENGAECSP